MQKIFGAKKKERHRIQTDRKWWQFLKKPKVKPMKALDIQHHVKFDHYNSNNSPEYYEMEKYIDQDNNHYRQRRRKYDDNFMMQNEQTFHHNNTESSHDSLESSEISSDAFSQNFHHQQQRHWNNFHRQQQKQQQQENHINFNNITQHIQNNNNKITIIIKHNNDGPATEQRNTPQIIYIQPATSQPNLHSTNVNQIDNNGNDDRNMYNSLDDLETDELYQFYNESPIDVPDDFKRNSYLVLNLNDGGNKKFKRRICTPTRNLMPLPIIDEPKYSKQMAESNSESIDRIVECDNNVKIKHNQSNNNITNSSSNSNNFLLKQSVISNTQSKAIVPPKPKQNIHQQKASTLQANSISKSTTFGERKKNFQDYYNWNVVFPPTTIHENSILYRDTALNNSFRNKWKLVSEKMMTMGSNLGNDFGGSTKELSPRKIKNAKLLLEQKHAKSEISLNQIKDEETKAQTSILLNMIGLPFNWKSRMLMSRNGGSTNTSEKNKRRPNMLTNFWKKKRIGDALTCNKRIQDSDGGFFERFGSILYSQSENHEEKVLETASLASPSIEDTVARKEIVCSEATVESRFGCDDEGKDSGNESAEADSDSEDKREEQFKKLQNSLVGMNIEELYEEVLYEIIHNVGSDESKIEPEKMFNFMQEAFKIPEETHADLLEKAKFKEAPELRLNIEIIEAKDLNSKDPNGLADPFVTLFIASAPTTRYTSSVKSGTLNPKYEEHFSLPISENPNDDTLVIEVWDFDPAETLGEKMNKFFDVKGAKGFRKLMKEIAATASSGKHDNEFVGSAKVPLKTIPASGLTMWYNLDKKGKTKTQGTIKVRLNFSSEKNDQVASQEHRHLLKILLYHELEMSQVAHYWWSGKFSKMAEIIVTQHQAQSGLTDIDVAFAQWSVFTEVHQHHPLSFELFESILDMLIRPIQTKTVSHDEEISLFWEATKRLLPSCFGIIRKLRKKLAGDPNALKHLVKALNIIAKVSMLEPPEGFDLFPEQYYGWLKKDNSSPSWDIRDAINQAVEIGTEEYYESIVDHNELNSDDNDVRLQQLIKIIQLVRSDLQRAIEHHDKVFQESMNYQYAGMIYKVYDKKLMVQVKPVVVDICNTKIERLDLLDRKDMKHNRYEEINMLTTLFELYLLLKRFTVLGTALCPGVTEFDMSDYYQWFTNGVAHWLDISLYKALIRIKKAIDLDSLIAVDATVKYSSSAVDTLAIFYQIRIFWQQLAWPNAEGAFIFVSKIVDDICKCCTFYGDTMAERVDNLGMVETVYEKKFQVTPEWCLAINNIDYIRQSIHSFVKEMGVDDIIRNMSDFRGPLDAQRCSDTLQNVIENAIDTGKNKIYELVQKLARKMNPAMRRFLVEGAELFDTDSNSMDRLMMYMEDSLKTLHTELNEDNFMRILDAIWEELASILYDLVHSSLEKRRPPAFYANLRATLQVLVENFKCQNEQKIQSTDKETLEKIDRLLEIHGFETADLIHQYYKDRYTMQRNMSDTPYGILTIQCYFQRNTLEVEVMNAKHLLPMNNDGTCDPFVRIHFFPEDKFLSIPQPKTKVHQKTLFPLFDERFAITLNDDQRKMDEAIILFSVKDHDYFGMANQYVAEAFIMFKDIADITSDSGSIKQLHLTLTRPQNDDMETVKALQYRVGDKLAKEFLKKLKTKMSDTQAR